MLAFFCYCMYPGLCQILKKKKKKKMMFLRTPKYSSKLVMTESYTPRFSSSIPVVSSTSCASGPMEYNKVLICLPSLRSISPEATLNCSNLCFHFGHCAGWRKSNVCIGCSCIPAICCHHVAFALTCASSPGYGPQYSM